MNQNNWDPIETATADLGELGGALTHEVNTLLNNISLHLALLKRFTTEAPDGDLRMIKQQIAHTAHVLGEFQRRRGRDLSEPALVDVNRALSDAAKTIKDCARLHGTASIEILGQHEPSTNADMVQVILEQQPDLAGIMAHPGDVRRLCRFLLANAVRAVEPGGAPVVARTAQKGSDISITVEDAGPEVPPENISKIFEPGQSYRPGMSGLELAACRSIVRRLRGTMDAGPRPSGGGLVISVCLHATVK